MRSVIVFFALVTGASAFQARSPSARRSVTKVCKPPQRRGKQASLRVGGKRKAVLLAGDSPRTGGLLGWQRASWCRSESRSSSRRSRRRRRRNISSSSSSGSGGSGGSGAAAAEAEEEQEEEEEEPLEKNRVCGRRPRALKITPGADAEYCA